MEIKKKKYYKPGQIVTVDRRVYRLQKGVCRYCPAYRAHIISNDACRYCWWKFHLSRKGNTIELLNLKPIK